MKKWLVALSLLALGGTLSAEVSKPENEAGDSPKQVCFSEEVTGSHLRKRICMTEEERERRRQADQDTMNKLRGSSVGTGSRDTGAER